MKSERDETVTVLEGFETLANPTGLSLIERELPEEDEPDEELPEDEEPEEDEPELDEPEELEEPKKPLLFPRVSTSQLLESAEKEPLVLTRRLRITLRFEYSADFTELERVPIELRREPNFEATFESIFQPMYCWSPVPIAAFFAAELTQPLPPNEQFTTAPWL
jgi:hypothetical protein